MSVGVKVAQIDFGAVKYVSSLQTWRERESGVNYSCR